MFHCVVGGGRGGGSLLLQWDAFDNAAQLQQNLQREESWCHNKSNKNPSWVRAGRHYGMPFLSQVHAITSKADVFFLATPVCWPAAGFSCPGGSCRPTCRRSQPGPAPRPPSLRPRSPQRSAPRLRPLSQKAPPSREREEKKWNSKTRPSNEVQLDRSAVNASLFESGSYQELQVVVFIDWRKPRQYF